MLIFRVSCAILVISSFVIKRRASMFHMNRSFKNCLTEQDVEKEVAKISMFEIRIACKNTLIIEETESDELLRSLYLVAALRKFRGDKGSFEGILYSVVAQWFAEFVDKPKE